MGLMHPAPTIRPWQHNMTATPSLSAPGSTVTASGSTNTKGSYATLLASTDYDTFGFWLIPANQTDVNTLTTMLFDIAIGAAASEVVILANIVLGSGTQWSGGINAAYFPLYVAKGTRISARCQSAIASQTVSLIVQCIGGGSHSPVYSGAETIGADTANSRFASHTSGSTGTYSTYADFGGTSTRAFKAFMPLFQQHTDTTMTASAIWIRIGIGGTTLAQYVTHWQNVEYVAAIVPPVPTAMHIPSGTQFQTQMTSNTTADTDYSIGLLGFY